VADRLGVPLDQTRWHAVLGTARVRGEQIAVMLPQTYMNASGESVGHAMRFWKVEPGGLVVVHDELDLELGRIQVKMGGGDGGHNGLRSVTAALSSKDYLRVRLGIGRPPGRQDPADFVLRDFSAAERKDLAFHVDRAADAVEVLLRDGLEAAQNEFND
jgi:PTH1 family peptidyl-tRNA hydrolase